MRTIRWLTLTLVFALSVKAGAQLPSESVLPGESANQLSFPSEAELPSYVVAQLNNDSGGEAAASGRQLDLNDGAAADGNSVDLPDEGRLPPPQLGAGDGQAVRGGGLPIANSPDGIPWLRMNLAGHSAPLRTLTFTADGNRICSAGDDKNMLVWRRDPAGNGQVSRWAFERTVRWQVQRGPRGRVYALAAGRDYVALAGVGAMGGAGEILLVDPQSGELKDTLNDLDNGHRQVVVALSNAPGADGDTLASLSMDGCLLQWNRGEEGLWRATRVRGADAEVHSGDPALTSQLFVGRRFAAVAAISRRRIVAPSFSRSESGRIIWRLESFDAVAGGSRPLISDDQAATHWDHVTAMAVSGDGRLLASADGVGSVYLWDLGAPRPRLRKLPRQTASALSLSFDATGQRLAIGTAETAAGRATVAVWDVSQFSNPRQSTSITTDQSVSACALSPNGRNVAWTNGSAIRVRSLPGESTSNLASGAAPPLRVAFPQERPYHTLGFSKRPTADSPSAISYEFDTSRLRLDVLNPARNRGGQGAQAAAQRWLPSDWLSRGWNVRAATQADGKSAAWLYEGGARRARIPLRQEFDGAYRNVCWIPSRVANAKPIAAAVGTDSGGIYLFQLAEAGDAPTIRQLRGHTAAITSLAVSRDLRYLASSSLDGTVRVWPLKNIVDDPPLVQRWGAEFQLSDGALVAASMRADGPTYFRGMREGDRIAQLRYIEGGEEFVLDDPKQMRSALERVDWNTLMTFQFVRGRQQPREFQILPSWQQLATLFVADDGQWAYWAPAGFYDASFEGHKLFGWQINRGLALLPDFFLAAQFRQQLERPTVMSHLLRTGDLESAFRAAQLEPPANSPAAIVNAYRLKPQVEILAPRDGEVVRSGTKLRARLSVDAAERLVPPKAFANGVVAVNRRLVSSSTDDGLRSETYEWDLSLPSDPQLLLQVLAATESEITESDQVVVTYNPPPRSQPAQLHLLSVGVDAYRDAQIPKLNTAVQSTHDFLALMEQRSGPLFRIDAASLLDDRATKPSWQYLTSDFADRLRSDVSPDDLLVVFLSGHGVQAADGTGYQFVTADARYADVLSGQYADCLSFEDLSLFADVPCRKLVILNTCHGGSIQPLMHRELKTAVRELQHDLLITLAASGGEQEAVEGRFAKRLLEALGGAADADSDGYVAFDETVAYVQRTVAADSAGEAVRQMPVAGPKELLPYLSLRLAEGATAVGTENRPARETERRLYFALSAESSR